MRRIGLLAVVIGLSLGADELKGGDAKSDRDGLQGRWAMVSFEVNGESVPEAQVKSGSLVVDGDRYTPVLGGRQVTFTMVLDPATSPKSVDFTIAEGPTKGQTFKGIYKRTEDTLMICRGLTRGSKRPPDFGTGAESGHSLVVWRRSKAPEGGNETLVKDELARFQGTWQLVSAESEGRKTPEEQVKAIRVTITGNTHTVRFGDQVIAHDVSFAVDPTKTPKETTDTINEGPDKGKEIRGIYRLEGDTLTSCVARVGQPRPTAFASEPGSGLTLRVFRRVKPE